MTVHTAKTQFIGLIVLQLIYVRAAAWQNQQMTVRTAKTQDQPGHLHSPIRVFILCLKGSKDPNSLHVDSEDSDQESLLGAQITLLVL